MPRTETQVPILLRPLAELPHEGLTGFCAPEAGATGIAQKDRRWATRHLDERVRLRRQLGLHARQNVLGRFSG